MEKTVIVAEKPSVGIDEIGLSEGELYNAQCPKCETFVVRTKQSEEW